MEYPQSLSDLRTLLDQGQDYRTLHPDFVRECIKSARKHYNDRSVCVPISPLELHPGQAISFTYLRPDENEPWRFGVVNEYRTGCWNCWTFNIEWVRQRGPKGGRGKKEASGPAYRSYSIEHMDQVRIITGKPEEVGEVPVNLLEKFLASGAELLKRMKPGEQQ